MDSTSAKPSFRRGRSTDKYLRRPPPHGRPDHIGGDWECQESPLAFDPTKLFAVNAATAFRPRNW
jgi:hypothetical protein